jgi:CheY-like chemotaxis protein
MAKRILIADDSLTIQKAFAMTFLGEDVTVSAARSADEGLALAQRLRPDLIIADGAMPGRTGYDLCAQVRADPALRALPVYILTSNQQPYDEARGQSAGANGHFVKPWDATVFIEKVATALGTVAPAPRAAVAPPPPAMDDDEYGEISIEGSGPVTPAPVPKAPAPSPSLAPRAAAGAMPSVPAVPAMRPSLIPGMRPGVMPPARPGTAPVRPVASQAPAPAAVPPRPAAPPVGRTMIGLPAAGIPIPGAPRPAAPAVPSMAPLAPSMRPPTAPMAPLSAPPLAPPPASSPLSFAPPAVRPRVATPTPPPAVMAPAAPAPRPRLATPLPPSAVSNLVDQKMATLSAKGPEYEAIAKLSREIIEQIVWEVVPELAEAIIREQVEKRNLG